jgi:hypothetical protein
MGTGRLGSFPARGNYWGEVTMSKHDKNGLYYEVEYSDGDLEQITDKPDSAQLLEELHLAVHASKRNSNKRKRQDSTIAVVDDTRVSARRGLDVVTGRELEMRDLCKINKSLVCTTGRIELNHHIVLNVFCSYLLRERVQPRRQTLTSLHPPFTTNPRGRRSTKVHILVQMRGPYAWTITILQLDTMNQLFNARSCRRQSHATGQKCGSFQTNLGQNLFHWITCNALDFAHKLEVGIGRYRAIPPWPKGLAGWDF